MISLHIILWAYYYAIRFSQVGHFSLVHFMVFEVSMSIVSVVVASHT